MPQIIDPFNVTTATAAKIKEALEYRDGMTYTDAEAKAQLREMVRALAELEIRAHLRRKAESTIDNSDVVLED